MKNSSWVLGGKTAGAVLSLVYLALLARALGPENFGNFMLIFSFAQLVTGLVAFQTWQIIIRYGTAHAVESRLGELAQLVWICLSLDVLGLVIGTILALGGAFAMGYFMGWSEILRQTAMLFSLIYLLSARATPIGILRVFDRFRDAALADTLVPIIRFVGVLAAVVFMPTLNAFLFIWAVSEIGTTIILWVIVMRTIKLPMRKHSPLLVLRYARNYDDLFSFATLSNLSSSIKLAGQQGIVLVVGFFAGAASAGFFRLGHQLGQVLARVADALSYSVFTEHSLVSHQHGGSAASEMIMRLLKITAVSAVIIFTILIAVGKTLIVTIFGPGFAPAFPFVLLLGGAAAVQVASSALEPALLSQGLAGRVLRANSLGALAIGAVSIALIPQHEAIGAAIAVLVGTVITATALGLSYRSAQKKPV